MARIKNGLLSGKVGDVVYYIKDGKQFIRKAPCKKGDKPISPSEALQRLQFKKATVYAKSVMENQELYDMYHAHAKPNQAVYNLAMRDARVPPQVLIVDARRYIGNPGDEILIDAADDFNVKSVSVMILNQRGEILEEGEAILPGKSFDWQYIATELNLDTEGCKIIATAHDLPGNKGSLEIQL